MKSCQYKSSDELPLILNVQEVSNFLGLGLSQVYELVKRIDFPAFNVVHSPSAVVRGDYESDLANCLNPSNSTDLDPTSQ